MADVVMSVRRCEACAIEGECSNHKIARLAGNCVDLQRLRDELRERIDNGMAAMRELETRYAWMTSERDRLRKALESLVAYVETVPYQAGVLPLKNARAALSEGTDK